MSMQLNRILNGTMMIDLIMMMDLIMMDKELIKGHEDGFIRVMICIHKCVSQNNHMEFHCCLQDWNCVGKCKYCIYVKLFYLYASMGICVVYLIKRTEIKRKCEYCDKHVCLK